LYKNPVLIYFYCPADLRSPFFSIFVTFYTKNHDMTVIKTLIYTALFSALSLSLISWGSLGHSTIGRKSAECFPASMTGFQVWTDSLSMHGSDADNRKGSDSNESPKHYIDIDNYAEFLSKGRIASTYDSIVNLHGYSTVRSNGTLPWATMTAFDSLKSCFQKRRWHDAMLFASDLGHYVADGHMPLHITANYDGAQTNQSGIHSRYESYMVGTYISGISAYTGTPAMQISDVNKYIFGYIYKNYLYVDSVLTADKYATSTAGATGTTAYYTALWSKTRFTTTLFKNASHALADLIYTAWLQAGSPVYGSKLLSSVNEVEENHSSIIYPNPTLGIINCRNEIPEKIEIYSVDGTLSGIYKSLPVDISHLAAGLYIVKLYNKEKVISKEKIVLIK